MMDIKEVLLLWFMRFLIKHPQVGVVKRQWYRNLFST